MGVARARPAPPAFKAIANLTDRRVCEVLLKVLKEDEVNEDTLDERGQAVAVLAGASTAVVRLLNTLADTGCIPDPDAVLAALLRQMEVSRIELLQQSPSSGRMQ